MGRCRARCRSGSVEAVARHGNERDVMSGCVRCATREQSGATVPQRCALSCRRAPRTELGIEAYNILDGFEGALNNQTSAGS